MFPVSPCGFVIGNEEGFFGKGARIQQSVVATAGDTRVSVSPLILDFTKESFILLVLRPGVV